MQCCCCCSNRFVLVQSDFVVRFNWPPIDGYELFVGNKTDVMMTGSRTGLQSTHEPFTSYRDYLSTVLVVAKGDSSARYWERLYNDTLATKDRLQIVALSQFWRELGALDVLRKSQR